MSRDEFRERLRNGIGGYKISERRLATAIAVGSQLMKLGDEFIRLPKLDWHSSKAVFAFGILLGMLGQLVRSAALLMSEGMHYASAALARQVVEIEYLTWAFMEGHQDAAAWLESTHEERRALFSPANLRKTSKGRFLDKDYRDHCEQGGHPVPIGAHLLAPSGASQLLIVDLLLPYVACIRSNQGLGFRDSGGPQDRRIVC